MWQVSEQRQFVRPMARGRSYTLKQSVSFLLVIPVDVAFLLMIILLVGALIKLIA